MDVVRAQQHIHTLWQQEILPQLIEYVAIPCKSPAFDAQWKSHGHMDQAALHIANWCKRQPVHGLNVEIVSLENRTPLIYMDIPGNASGTVLLYGHLDKQPEMSGWRSDLGPWKPVMENGKLYGRGGADDGYAAYAAITAIATLQQQGIPHARCVILIEASEESGSPDLPAYMDALQDRVGEPDLVICLDSGCGNYDQLWCTTSLRGLVGGKLNVTILREGVHSGDAGGVVPSTFRIARQLLDRIEEPQTGALRLPELSVDIPDKRRQQARLAAHTLGDGLWKRFPFTPQSQAVDPDPVELILNRTWRGALEVIGADGLPPTGTAGNVARPSTQLMLSVRIPPTADAQQAQSALIHALTTQPPYNAQVTFEPEQASNGWHAPVCQDWLAQALDHSSQTWFGYPARYMGEGGTIPFMGMLGHQYPRAQFLITGVLGPQSNAHGPNEFLHLATAERLTGCVASILERHASL